MFDGVSNFVDSVDVVNDYTVKFILTGPVAYFPSLVASVPYFPVNPNVYPEDRIIRDPSELIGGALVGLGPYKVISFKRDEEIILQVNTDFYGNKAKIDKIVIRYFADATTMRLAFEKGEIDLVYKTLNPSDINDLADDPKYQTREGRSEDTPQLRQTFQEIFITKTYEEWRPLLEGIPYAPRQTLKEAVNDVQARESGCFVAYDHPQQGRIEQLANPVMMSQTPSSVRMAAPEFGQHTEEVLLEYGYTWEDIAVLKEEGTIA